MSINFQNELPARKWIETESGKDTYFFLSKSYKNIDNYSDNSVQLIHLFFEMHNIAYYFFLLFIFEEKF